MEPLTPERWRRIDALYAAALEQPREERDAFVEKTAGADSELLREVRALLASHAAAERALERPAAEAASLLAGLLEEPESASAGSLIEGTRVGPYRIVREIARGGMGAVYLAERADEQFEQRVALKLVKRGMDSDEILRRFRHERQILASLEHPHIARLLDGGVGAQGQPYLAMEYVPGLPIDRYCDERRLTVEARLALFEGICEAVQYAHRQLVVHRDLKPSNILVTEEGVPKLLDFGIAKLLVDDGLDAPHTRTGMRVLTPEYASPEQVVGGPITVASDVYSLGVVLYRLLAGRAPYRVRGRNVRDAERATLEEEAERPSSAVARRAGADAAASLEPTTQAIAAARGVTIEGLRRRLRGDLDAIVLKALEKEPARRYGSVEQLLDDLRRHRARLPVRAHATSARYRAGKFIRRHRGPAAAATLFVLLLGGFAAATAVQQRETAQERDRAEQERDKAEEVAAFLESLFAASDPFLTEGERLDTLPVRDFLARGAARVQREMSSQPLVQARMLDVVGRVHHSLGLYPEARTLLEQALSLRQRLLGAQHPEIASTLNSIARVLRAQGELDVAESHAQQALAMRQRLHGGEHPEIAESLNELGLLLRSRGRYGDAEAQHLAALDMLRHTADSVNPQAIAVTSELAATLEEAGDYESAEQYFRLALELRRQLHGADHPQVAAGLNGLSVILQRRGEYAAAEVLIREAFDIVERALGPKHPETAGILNRLASVRYWQGDYESAEALHRRSLALKRELHGEDHLSVAIGIFNLTQVLLARGELDEGETMIRRSIALLRGVGGEEHPLVPVHESMLGAILQEQGNCRAAVPLFRESVDGIRRGMPADRLRVPLIQRRLGRCLTTQGRYAEAESVLLESYHGLRALRGEQDDFTRQTRAELAALYTAWGRPESAARYAAQ